LFADPTVVDAEFRGFEMWRSAHHWYAHRPCVFN